MLLECLKGGECIGLVITQSPELILTKEGVNFNFVFMKLLY